MSRIPVKVGEVEALFRYPVKSMTGECLEAADLGWFGLDGDRTSATVDEVGRLAAEAPDVRRFRPNILMRSLRSVPFEEDEWVGGVLSFGETNGPVIAITNRDERCSVVNLEPGSARPDPAVLKAIVQERNNYAGVYATVTRRGRLAVGKPVFFEPAPEHRPV